MTFRHPGPDGPTPFTDSDPSDPRPTPAPPAGRGAVALRTHGLAWTAPGRGAPLFEALDLTLAPGERLGVVGPNGCGKSTLLRLLAGRVTPGAGTVRAEARPWYVPQSLQAASAGATLRLALFALDPELGPLRARLRAAEAAGVPDPDGYATDLGRYDDARGWAAERRAEIEAERLGFDGAALDRPADGASGGERRMLALAAALARRPALLLLDEPSDALDETAAGLLVRRLVSFDGTLVVASHDRTLLAATTGRTLAFEKDGLRLARGGYDRYVEARAAERSERERRAARARREIAHLEQVVRGYRTWSGRKEKEKSGAMDKGFVGARAARLMKRAVVAGARREAEIEALRRSKPWIEPDYALPMPEPSSLTGAIFDAHAVTATPDGAGGGSGLERGRPPFAPLTLGVHAGERLAVAGPNGSGKSTLLALLVGRLAPRSGTIRRARRARVGFLAQAASAMDRDFGADPASARTAASLFSAGERPAARRRLGALDYGAEAWSTPLAGLSGGQRQKLRLALLLAARPDVLVLDEPTLHLDLPAIERLQEALARWPGTIVLVSHDAAFRDGVAQRVVTLSDLDSDADGA